MKLVFVFLITLVATYSSWVYFRKLSIDEVVVGLKLFGKFTVLAIVSVAILGGIYMVF